MFYTLGFDGIEEKKRIDKGGEGKNSSRREFLLFEILRLWVYSIENFESLCLSPFIHIPFIAFHDLALSAYFWA